MIVDLFTIGGYFGDLAIFQQGYRYMAKALESGDVKIQEICDILRKETLEPAKIEAEKIISDAKNQAQEILLKAEKEGEKLIQDGHARLDQEKRIFESALKQSARLAFESLKQSIEEKLFNTELSDLVVSASSKPQAVADLIEAIVTALEKEGTQTNLAALVPKTVSASEVSKLLGSEALKKLKEGTITLGDFDGGAKIKVVNKKVTLDISDDVLKKLLADYVRKDFRNLIFQA